MTLIRPRSQWTSLPVSLQCANQTVRRPVLYVHYSDAPARKLKTVGQQVAAIANIRDYHVNHNGWSDIGYSYVLAQPWGRRIGSARVWTARGRYKVPASQQNYNAGSLSVCVLAAPGEPLLLRSQRAIAQLARHVDAVAIRAHRDVNSTDCPGDAIFNALPAIRRRAHL